jgi:ATP-binding cassette subfamily C protein
MNKYFNKTKLLLFLNLLFIFLLSFFVSLLPVITQSLIDNLGSINKEKILIYIFSYIGAIALIIVCEYFNKLTNAKYRKKVMLLLKGDIFKQILLFSYKDYKKNDTDYYLNLLLEDSKVLFNDYYDTILDLLKSIIQALVFTIVMFFLNWILALVILVLSMLSLIIPELLGGKLSKKRAEVSKLNQQYISRLKDLLSGVDIVSSTTKEPLSSIYAKTDLDKESTNYKYSKLSSFMQIFTGISLYIVNIGVFIVGILLINESSLLVGQFVALISFTELMALPFRDILYQILGIKSSKDIRLKFNEIFQYTPKNKTLIPNINNSINLEHIYYKVEDFEIKDLNISFEIGKKYAIIGPSASGKTTILKILMGFIENYEGGVIIDGLDSRDYDLGKVISYVDQNQFIFNSTGLDNITLFSGIESKNLGDYAKKINASYLLNRNLGEFGGNISGGEKNKIAILRALNNDTKIIVCDEILSNLDNESKDEIMNFLLTSNLTVIMVTHDIFNDNLNKFDEIIKISNGQRLS